MTKQLTFKGDTMKFHVRYSYNLDLLNLINVLTAEGFYVGRHKGIFEIFGETLSRQSKDCIREAVEINGSAMLGPLLCLIISAVPNFERRSVVRMFSDMDLLQDNFKRFGYYEAEDWPKNASIFGSLLPVVRELEIKGFREYWQKERLPQIKRTQRQFRSFANRFHLDHEIEEMLGLGQTLESITVYLCTFAAPHGIKVCGPQYITDVVFSKETSLGIAVHEMFHPPYNAKNLEKELQRLGDDPLLKHAFETKDPRFGYSTMEDFIEENVVEAMAIFICHKLGIEKDPLAYFAKHDGGSHMLSVVLFDYFKRYPKSKNQIFEEYFQELLQILPIGSMDSKYNEILQ
jgi:hypothetical protein